MHSKKLFALAAQKFIADIATDAFQFNKVKRSTTKANKVSCFNEHDMASFVLTSMMQKGKENCVEYGRPIKRIIRIWSQC